MNNYDKIPKELKLLPYWLTWRYVKKDNNKKPVKAPNQRPADWPNNLSTFDEVIKTKNNYGIGIVIDGDLVGIDIDNVDDNNLPDDIKAILKAGETGYIERSISGHGYHIIGYCSDKNLLLENLKQYNGGTGTRRNGIELYASRHFFTVSGNVIHGNYGCIDEAIMLTWAKATGKPYLSYLDLEKQIEKKPDRKPTSIRVIRNPQCQNKLFNPEKRRLLKMPGLPMEKTIALMFKNEPTLKSVLENGYKSAPDEWFKSKDTDRTNSGIDIKIAGILCHWLYRYGEEEILSVMQESAIYRDSKHEDYLSMTVKKAYEGITDPFPSVDPSKLTYPQKREYNKWKQKQNEKIKN